MIKNKFISFVLFLFSIIYIGCYYPAFYNQFLLSQELIGPLNCLIIAFVWIIILLFVGNKYIIFPNKNFTFSLFIISVYLIFRIFIFNETSSIGYLNTIIVSWLLVILNINSFKTKQYMLWMNRLLLLMFVSILIGIIVIAIKGLTIFGDIEINDKGHHILNLGFFFTKYGVAWGDEFVRPSGWFDEPGSLANVVLLFLIYNRLRNKSKKIDLYILLGGCLSMSMAFFIITILYIILFYINRNNIKFIIIFICVVSAFYLWKPQDGFLNYAWNISFGRVENIIEGDDNSRNYDIAFKAFEKYYLTGQNDILIKNEFYGATQETLWFILANHGIIGILFYYYPFIFIFISIIKNKKNRKEELYMLFLFFVNLAQRPIYLFPLYLLLIYYIWFDKKQIFLTINNTKK